MYRIAVICQEFYDYFEELFDVPRARNQNLVDYQALLQSTSISISFVFITIQVLNNNVGS